MNARGFTLMELLIALAIFALMAAMAYGGLASVLESRETVDAALERTQTLQGAMFRIQADIEQTMDRPIRDRFGDTQPALLGSADLGLSVTRNGWRNPLQSRRSHLQRVQYRLDEDNRLIRAHWRVLDQAQDSAPVEAVLAEDIEAIEWRFLDTNREWQDRWPPLNLTGGLAGAENVDAGLPLAVELRMEAEGWGDLRYLFQIPEIGS